MLFLKKIKVEKLSDFFFFYFQAAKHFGWIPTAKLHGLSFAGYQTHGEAVKLVYLLQKALTRCISIVKQGIPEIVL